MNTKFFLAMVNIRTDAALTDNKVSYLIGGIIALLIMGYLIYSLLRPDRF